VTGTFLMQLWEELKATGPLAWIADITGVVYVLLVMKRRRAGWIFGAISSALLTVVGWQAHLPMQALLQFSYVLAAGYGWWSWSRQEGTRPIGVWHWRGHLAALACCVVASLLLARVLAHESAFPFFDSLVFCAGMFATWLLARVYLENWAYWILIDSASIYLSFRQGLFSVVLLYLLYMGIAVAGLAGWWKTWRKAA
jgi:nicotinamide mononucleotide transporter